MGGHHNSNFIFGCFHFLPFLAIFGHFWAIFAFLGIFAFLSGFKRTSERVQYSLFPQIIFHIVVLFRIWGGQGQIALPEEYDLFAKFAPRFP